ncbi:hypothetical protein PCCS19_24680 [Paenibacillus sp. CCS19]|uniref:X2-like carbohydrate binding domain-containing protein n=1 Tax=Paenibacillus sp. CCS19 TaxID=3158387 RepID=UPI00256CEE44|nr:X2-like carbohydrate binding domain-containing protein [Paenibacillus cellulosilyticus]GMK39414.1 hypothetical protein PCCS19_24680 [Paenibacillus cellulosilyticus]
MTAAIFDKLFGQLDAFSKQIGMPVVIGEYGTLAIGTVEKHAKWIYTDSFVRAAHKYDIATMVWDIGFDQLDRTNDVLLDPINTDILINASKDIADSFVSQDSLYLEDGKELNDQTVSLELNGNKLISIYDGTKKLKQGKDYTVSGSNLTITKGYLSSLTQDLGVGAHLRFRFNHGADQTLDLINYKKPVIATVEYTIHKGAVNEDLAFRLRSTTNWMPNTPTGGLRGGINFNDDFKSDSNNIYLTKDILNKLDDDTLFSFKFWPRDQEVSVDVIVHAEHSS